MVLKAEKFFILQRVAPMREPELRNSLLLDVDFVMTEPSIKIYIEAHDSERQVQVNVEEGPRGKEKLVMRWVPRHFTHLGFDENNFVTEMRRDELEECVLKNTQILQDVYFFISSIILLLFL